LSGTGNSGWVKQTLNYNSGEGGKQSGVFSGSGALGVETIESCEGGPGARATEPYKEFTPRTFVRELTRLNELGFITLNGAVLELDFDAIAKY
jgi:hypothetical protein